MVFPMGMWLTGRSAHMNITGVGLGESQGQSRARGPVSRYYQNDNVWNLKKAEAGGGCLINIGIHFPDLYFQVPDVGGSLHH